MTRAATENTTTAPIEMEAALELLGRHARQQLQQGHTVRVGDLGTIRVSFKSDGVENITDFNAGVLDEGISYASLSDYKKAKGITSGGSDDSGGSSIGGGGTGEDGEGGFS